MDIQTQILSIIFSYLYGFFYSMIYNLRYKNKSNFIKFLFIIIVYLMYLYFLYKINFGVIHYYFIMSFFLGYFTSNFVIFRRKDLK